MKEIIVTILMVNNLATLYLCVTLFIKYQLEEHTVIPMSMFILFFTIGINIFVLTKFI